MRLPGTRCRSIAIGGPSSATAPIRSSNHQVLIKDTSHKNIRQRGMRRHHHRPRPGRMAPLLLLAAVALAAAAAAEPELERTPHAWPVSYKVGNAHHGHAGLALRGESFTVYSRPMRTQYAEVYNVRQAPIPLPPAIVERFRGKVIAITGYDIDVVQRLPDGSEVSVPSRDFYNHHYILGLRSALYHPPTSMQEGEGAGNGAGDEEMAAEQRQHARAHDHRPPSEEVVEEDEARRRRRFPLPSQGGKGAGADPTLLRGRRRRPPAAAIGTINNSSLPSSEGAPELRLVSTAISERAETIPLIQVFCEANGGEFRQSLHGYPRGHAQLLKSPQSFWPFQLHFINTRASAGRIEPTASRAPPDAQYSGLIECPCTTRRVKDAGAHTIDGRPVSFDCRGEVLRQNNSVCALATYQGGYRCCESGMVLLDADQTQPAGTDEYHLKVRFWFEEYREEEAVGQEEEEEQGGLGVVRASHAHLFRLYLQTEQQAGEYDVPPCNPTTTRPEDCVHVLTSLNLAKELFFDCSFVDSKECADSKALAQAEGGFQIIYAAGHMHVGGLSLELYNMDTGELLCRQVPEYVGGYVEAIPPCVWSEEEGDGLPQPPVLKPETRLMSLARYDSSYKGHLGVMASWQARAMYRPGTTTTTSTAADAENPPPPYAHSHPPPRRRG